jgi:hypothetical protein
MEKIIVKDLPEKVSFDKKLYERIYSTVSVRKLQNKFNPVLFDYSIWQTERSEQYWKYSDQELDEILEWLIKNDMC